MTQDQIDMLARMDAQRATMEAELAKLAGQSPRYIFAFETYSMGIAFEGGAPKAVALWRATEVAKNDRRTIQNGNREYARVTLLADALRIGIQRHKESREYIAAEFAADAAVRA